MLAWSLASFAKSVPTRIYLVPSNSMAPTIKSGDRIGVQARAVPRPERGEIWVFLMPTTTGAPTTTIIKRVIGLPGETIEVRGGKVRIDDKALAEPYLSAPMTYTMSPVKLGADEFFMLGDSRDASQDSHIWGPLPRNHLIGPVTLRYWPLSRAGGF